jgi:hypothetical protein
VYRYVLKLKAEVEEMGMEVFGNPGDRDRIKSVLADLSKTSSDFKAITNKALDHLANGLVPRLRFCTLSLALAILFLGR